MCVSNHFVDFMCKFGVVGGLGRAGQEGEGGEGEGVVSTSRARTLESRNVRGRQDFTSHTGAFLKPEKKNIFMEKMSPSRQSNKKKERTKHTSIKKRKKRRMKRKEKYLKRKRKSKLTGHRRWVWFCSKQWKALTTDFG